MFSARTSWDRTENSLARALDRARAEGRLLYDLTESNPTRAALVDLTPLVAELGHPRGAVYEPAPLGHLEARRAVAGYYGARGARVSAERVVLSASTSEAYSWLFGLLADPDDTILVPRPSYPLLGWIAAQRRVRLVPYQLSREANFRIDLPDLRRAIDRRTRAIVLVNPNNPTGSFVRKDEIVELFSLAREHDLALIVDEVFADYPLDAAPTDVVSSFTELFEVGSGAAGPVAPLCFVLSGLSKVLLLPQCKLGWTVVNGPDELVTEALGRLELIADTFLSVSTPVQLALPALFVHRAALVRAVGARLRENLSALDAALARLGSGAPVRRLPTYGGWYATLEVARVRDEERWVELLIREDGVIVHPGYFFDFDRDGFLVVSLLPRPDVFREAAERLTRRLSMA
jgi:aspartate/methionine/tyrosine aminotransferase